MPRDGHGRRPDCVADAVQSPPARRHGEFPPLYKVVAEHLEGWLQNRAVAEQPVSTHVERELRSYLTCGILCFGFGRARCASCGQGFVVAFSCKGRGVCPTCNGRWMAQTGAWLARDSAPCPFCTASDQRSITTCTCMRVRPTASSCRPVTGRRRSCRPGRSPRPIWPRSPRRCAVVSCGGSACSGSSTPMRPAICSARKTVGSRWTPACGSRSSTATCRATFRVSSTC